MARTSRPAKRRSASRQYHAGSILLGLLGGLLLTIAGVLIYLRFGAPPVAVTDRAALWEPLVESVPLKARARTEAKTPPFAASEDVFEHAAHTYRTHCAQCHGTPGHDAVLGRAMLPRAPQFFTRHGLAAQAPGELFWKTAFGIRRSGMPAYNRTLSNTELWQLSLLLHGATTELPDPVRSILISGMPGPQPSVVQP